MEINIPDGYEIAAPVKTDTTLHPNGGHMSIEISLRNIRVWRAPTVDDLTKDSPVSCKWKFRDGELWKEGYVYAVGNGEFCVKEKNCITLRLVPHCIILA